MDTRGSIADNGGSKKDGSMKALMILSLVIFSVFSSSTFAEVIRPSTKLKVKNEVIIEIANQEMEVAIYWEDEGYEYKMLKQTKDVYIREIHKNDLGQVEKLVLTATVASGGFGWFPGYKEGLSYCTIEVEKKANASWSEALGHANCTTEIY